MSETVDTAPLHPLLDQLFSKHGFTAVGAATLDAFVHAPGAALLLFMEDPLRVRETLDLAVIGPELVAALPGRFRVGVALVDASRALQPRYGFRRYPTIVLHRDGAYVGAIEGLRDWQAYVEELDRLLASPPTRPPTIGIAVQGPAGAGACST